MTYGVFDLWFKEGVDQVNIGKIIDDFNGGITSISRGVGTGRTHTFGAGVGRYGDSHIVSALDRKTIKIEFMCNISIYETVRLRRVLAEALDSTKPEKLIFSDDPNNYWLAIVNGEVSLKETIGKEQVTGSISFVVPDGLMHSVDSKIIKRDKASDYGSIEYINNQHKAIVHINNPGTVETYPTIRFKNTSENGYYGLVHRSGVMEIGSKGATEDGSYKYLGARSDSEVLLKVVKGDNSETGWGQFKDASETFVENPVSVNDGIEGGTLKFYDKPTVDFPGGNDSSGLSWAKDGRALDGFRWNGGISMVELKPDKGGESGAVDFKLDFNIKAWTSVVGQTGYISVICLSKSNELICAYEIAKDSTVNNDALVKFEGPDGAAKPLKQIQFETNNAEKEAKKPNTGFAAKYGDAYIKKEGSRLTFMHAGTPYSFNVSDIKTSEVHKIAISVGGYNKPVAAGFFGVLLIQSIMFTKMHVKKFGYVENRYQPGSTLEVDLYKGTIRLSPDGGANTGQLAQSELVLGSSFFSVPKGKSDIEIMFSPWCKVLPDIEVEFRESSL